MLESQVNMKVDKLVLASNSPRRQQLIKLLEIPFDVRPADVDERQFPGETPEDYVRRLSLCKAKAITATPTEVIIAADTIVVHGEQVLGKPVDKQDAFTMLSQLRGDQHEVFSAVTMIDKQCDVVLTLLAKTDVFMRNYSDEEIRDYIATGDPMDKAGAYAIQHPGFKPVERINGCYASVMGFPLCHVARTLRRFDIDLAADVPGQCQALLAYHCPVHEAILSYQE